MDRLKFFSLDERKISKITTTPSKHLKQVLKPKFRKLCLSSTNVRRDMGKAFGKGISESMEYVSQRASQKLAQEKTPPLFKNTNDDKDPDANLTDDEDVIPSSQSPVNLRHTYAARLDCSKHDCTQHSVESKNKKFMDESRNKFVNFRRHNGAAKKRSKNEEKTNEVTAVNSRLSKDMSNLELQDSKQKQTSLKSNPSSASTKCSEISNLSSVIRAQHNRVPNNSVEPVKITSKKAPTTVGGSTEYEVNMDFFNNIPDIDALEEPNYSSETWMRSQLAASDGCTQDKTVSTNRKSRPSTSTQAPGQNDQKRKKSKGTSTRFSMNITVKVNINGITKETVIDFSGSHDDDNESIQSNSEPDTKRSKPSR